MAFKCKNSCGDVTEVSWQLINSAWLPAVSVCSSGKYPEAVCDSLRPQTCAQFSGATLLWDACYTDSFTETDNNVTVWTDLIEDVPLENISEGKEPLLTTFINGNIEFPTLEFNGINQGLIAEFSTTAFTVIAVVNGMGTNLSEESGGIFVLSDQPLVEQILLGWNNGNIVVQNGDYTGLVDIVEPIASPNGPQIVALRYDGTTDVGNVELFVNGGTASTNSESFSFTEGIQVATVGTAFGSYALNGQIAWIAYYDTNINNTDLNRAITFAANTYKISHTPVS